MRRFSPEEIIKKTVSGLDQHCVWKFLYLDFVFRIRCCLLVNKAIRFLFLKFYFGFAFVDCGIVAFILFSFRFGQNR